MFTLAARRLAWLISLLAFNTAAVSQSNVSDAVLTVGIDLLDAGHILHFLDIVDAFGHVSVRNPDNASQFLMSFSLAPALATSQSIVTYEIDNATSLQLTFNSSVTGAAVPSGFLERFIHSEIYKAFPTVQGVVHSHTTEILPFAGAGVPLTAQMHTAGSLGSLGTPIFDTNKLNTTILPENQPHDLLIRNTVLGDALARTFSADSQVVLMKGHGMAVRGFSVRDAVFRSFYTRQDATVQLQARLLGGHNTGLTAREAMDAENTTESDSLLGRAWQLWVAQVDNAGLYVNDLRMS
ncbi:arad-like aldolase/epimerase [Schizopora paradoxa]|uniref:Arad-like aldolase/epimerase n=1 Tax=Schizopora paradoxa TaxID=27342 RepID=A0A0H2RE22_9AGAM|nr:arad-like aldolase/epimerase [Schizopora paradoxa]